MNTRHQLTPAPPRAFAGIKEPTFSKSWLINRNFIYQGNTWGNENENYFSIYLPFGLLHVVSQSDVFIQSGDSITRVSELESVADLGIFLSLLT